jgi:hypothetical protein
MALIQEKTHRWNNEEPKVWKCRSGSILMEIAGTLCVKYPQTAREEPILEFGRAASEQLDTLGQETLALGEKSWKIAASAKLMRDLGWRGRVKFQGSSWTLLENISDTSVDKICSNKCRVQCFMVRNFTCLAI